MQAFDRFIENLIASFVQFWADISPKENHPMNNPFYTPEQLKEKLKDRAFQINMANWVEKTLRPLEDNQVYLKLCQTESTPITTDTLKKLFGILNPFMLLGTPAHDLGHHYRDALGGAAIVAKDLFLKSGYQNDLDAAFLAAMCHDGSTGVQHRYVDMEWELNHGELQAVIFYFATANLLPEPLRRLTAFAIAAHPHALKEMTAKNGAVRKPWTDQLFYDNGRPVRIAVWVARWTDRLENGGDSATHLARHALASTDGALVGGMDLHKVDWYSFTDGLKFLFTPQAIVNELTVTGKDGAEQIQKVPSMLQHLQGYRMSAGPTWSAYNQNDALSPSMQKLMGWKVANSIKFVDTVTNTVGEPDFEVFAKLMRMVSGSPVSDTSLKAIEMVRELWDLNTPEDQAHWAGGFKMAQTSYYEWLSFLSDEISGATNPTIRAFAPLVPQIVSSITKF